MKYMKIMFMLVLAIFIFAAASVCASDVNDTVIAGEDGLSQADLISSKEDKLTGQTDNVEPISDENSGTFAELQANITHATQGSTLTLNKNYECKDSYDTEGILIDKSITIDGNGFKIDAQGKSRIFKITADNVILKNIIFTNGKTTENGGAVYFEKSGAVTNCNFTNNHNEGGAVFFTGNGDVTNCNFAGNYGTNGSAIYFSSSGTLTNCNFTGNTATKNGGAVYFKNNGVLRNCNFKKSVSKNNGGAVYFEKSGNVTNCNFTGNTATKNGGAVYFSQNSEVAKCSFTNNTATENGGAVYFTGNGEMTNCSFTNNTATENGGAVYFTIDCKMAKCSFTYNSAKMGNAIYISNHGTVSDCDFTNNHISKGAIHSVTGDIALSNNILNADDAVRGRNFTELQKLIDRATDGDEITIDGLYAGFGIPIRITKSLTLIGKNNLTLDARKLSKILYITANNVIIKNMHFTNGYSENGGAVYFYRAGDVINCNFTNNEVSGEKSSGGAIYFNDAGNAINSIFTANRATRNGGAIYVEAQSINNLFSSQFYNNHAGQSGGAIFFHNSVQNNSFECIFKDNYAGYGGAMFFSKNANENRFSSDFINNTAKSCGGAIFFYSTTDKNNFTGRFINNSALGLLDPANGNGGAITFKNISSNSIFTCDFSNNTASLNGGAVNYRETPRNIIFNANFTNNTAKIGGGVNFFETFENVIFNGEFIENSAENGGAIATGYGNIKNVSFNKNHANNGGAVYLKGSGSTLNCNFTNNRATHRGGAVYISEKCNVANCSFEDNYAADDGGAVYSKSGTVLNSNFTSNAAKNDGGAVYLSQPSNAANCHFAHNSAINGGALYFLNDNDNVINCSFVGNNATTMGGAVFFMTHLQVTVTNCYFEGNCAPEGGAILCYNWGVTADSCIFKTDCDTTKNTNILSPTLNVYDFYSVYGSGEKLTFNLTANRGMPITNGIISMTIYLEDNGKNVFNHTCLSGEGWIVDLPVGSYKAVITTEYKGLEVIIRNIIIAMPNVRYSINVTSLTTTNKTVNITAKTDIPKNLLLDGKLLFILENGTKITATYSDNGTWRAEYTFDDYSEYKVSATYVGLDNADVKNASVSITKADSAITFDKLVFEYGDSINVKTVGAVAITARIDGNNVTAFDFTIPLSALDVGNHTLTVTTIADDDHNPVTEEVTITVNKVNAALTVNDAVLDYGASGSVTVVAKGATAITAKIGESEVKVDGFSISIPALDVGTYTLTVTAIADVNHNNITKNATITVNKLKTEFIGNAITATYNVNKNLVITLKDSTGKALSGAKVTVDLNGGKTYTTDKNGQVKVTSKGLAPKAYTAKVTFNGDTNYAKSTKDIKVTVKKATPKLTAKKKTFKRTVKTKKYTIVLKDNRGKAMKKVKVTLKIRGKKTITVKTNLKGKAIFKIKKLTKKGTYKATLTFKGNKYYNKVVKKVKIKIR